MLQSFATYGCFHPRFNKNNKIIFYLLLFVSLIFFVLRFALIDFDNPVYIYFRSAKRGDAGSYVLTASNSVGQMNLPVLVEVQYPAR